MLFKGQKLFQAVSHGVTVIYLCNCICPLRSGRMQYKTLKMVLCWDLLSTFMVVFILCSVCFIFLHELSCCCIIMWIHLCKINNNFADIADPWRCIRLVTLCMKMPIGISYIFVIYSPLINFFCLDNIFPIVCTLIPTEKNIFSLKKNLKKFMR